jgi:c-di-GMP-binding flagellar brake protein YcgR
MSESAMPENGIGTESPAWSEERRDDPRLPVDEPAELVLMSTGSRLAGTMVEMSLGGCRLRMRDRFLLGTNVRAELSFRLRGIAFRFSGVIEWTDRKFELGIRFVDVAARRMEELVQALCELAAEQAATAVKKAAERRAAQEAGKQVAAGAAPSGDGPSAAPSAAPSSTPAAVTAAQESPPPLKSPPPAPPPLRSVADYRPPAVVKPPELTERKPSPAPAVAASSAPRAPAGPLIAPTQAASPPAAKTAGRERRTQSRHEVDTTATLMLVNVGSHLSGRILNLSLGGCRIHTDERFPVGIYTRIETEFRLEGLPFRLGGVVQAVQDRKFVGIRFLDMSQRKREQLEQLIEEIDELRQSQQPQSAATEDSPAP